MKSDKIIEYENCIVTFIDVLGFKDMLSEKNASDVFNVLRILRNIAFPSDEAQAKSSDSARASSRAFADSVSDAVVRVRVFDTEFRDGAFFHEILDLIHIQIQCIQMGVLIRAGLTIGPAHVGLNGEGPFFGPSMARAYKIESEEAVYPRIVVDESAYIEFISNKKLWSEIHCLKQEKEYIDNMVKTGDDGTYFLDYLRCSKFELDGILEWYDFLNCHANIIRNKIGDVTGKLRRKYQWLEIYHNRVVSEEIEIFRKDINLVRHFESEYDIDVIETLNYLIC